MILDIKTYPNKILKQKAKPVGHFNDEIKKLINDMIETMYAKKGAGLAANQIGIAKEIIVIDPGDGLKIFINPKIVSRKGSHTTAEACLSVPGMEVEVKRPTKIEVEYLDKQGNKVKMKAQDLMARVICHEIDHLHGITILDKLPLFRKLVVKKRLRKHAKLRK